MLVFMPLIDSGLVGRTSGEVLTRREDSSSRNQPRVKYQLVYSSIRRSNKNFGSFWLGRGVAWFRDQDSGVPLNFRPPTIRFVERVMLVFMPFKQELWIVLAGEVSPKP